MGIHYNYNEKNCWSCDFFGGNRRENRGSLGSSIETSNKGICLCKKSAQYGKEILESYRCSNYQKWGVIVSSITIKKIEERQRDSLRQIEDKRRALERERKELEYMRWYNSLTPYEKIVEDKKREEKAKKEKMETELFFKKIKIIGLTFIGIISLVIMFSIISSSISNSNKSYNDKMQQFLDEEGRGNTYATNMSIGKYLATIEIAYSELGYSLENSFYNYRIKLFNYPTYDLYATSIESAIFFNLEKEKAENYLFFNNIYCISNIEYGYQYGVAAIYYGFSGKDSFDLSFQKVNYIFSDEEEFFVNEYKEEWVFYSKHALFCCFRKLDEICSTAGFDILK